MSECECCATKSAEIEEAVTEARETFIQMLNNRICFDNRAGGCDHQACRANLELIRDLEEGKTK